MLLAAARLIASMVDGNLAREESPAGRSRAEAATLLTAAPGQTAESEFIIINYSHILCL